LAKALPKAVIPTKAAKKIVKNKFKDDYKGGDDPLSVDLF